MTETELKKFEEAANWSAKAPASDTPDMSDEVWALVAEVRSMQRRLEEKDRLRADQASTINLLLAENNRLRAAAKNALEWLECDEPEEAANALHVGLEDA